MMKYYFNKTLNEDFDKVIEKVTEELKNEGFGILTEIDVKETLKKKLDVDFKKYNYRPDFWLWAEKDNNEEKNKKLKINKNNNQSDKNLSHIAKNNNIAEGVSGSSKDLNQKEKYFWYWIK